MVFFIVVAFILIFLVWLRIRTLSRRVEELTRRIGELSTGAVQQPPVPAPAAKPEKTPSIEKPRPAAKETRTTPETAPRTIAPAMQAQAQPVAHTAPAEVKKKEKPEFIKKLEVRFAENWTGILGAIILVVGVAFLGIYAALKMRPEARFAMIVLVAAGLFAVSIILSRKPVWKPASMWIRSSAGAVFLFACVGAGGIPGLRFIESPAAAIALLCSGIAVNIALGAIGGTQAFASLHAVLSLAALAVAPPSQTVLIITGITVLAGILLAFRGRWDWHLIIILSSYTVFHLRWYFALAPADGSFPPDLRITGIAVTALTEIVACVSHYRALYRDKVFDAVPFVAHLLNWIYLAVGLVMYSQGSKWNTIILGCASLVIFGLAIRARVLSIRWLFITDTLVAQMVIMIAAFTLTRWNVEPLFIATLLLAEIAVFVTIMLGQDSAVLKATGGLLTNLAAAGLIITVLVSQTPVKGIAREMAALSVALSILAALSWYASRRNDSDLVEAFLWGCGITSALTALTMQGMSADHTWSPWMIAGITVALLVMRQRFNINGLGIGLILLFAGMHVICWYHLFASKDTTGSLLLYAVPILIPSVASVWTSYYKSLERHVIWPAACFFFAHLAMAGYFILDPVSPFLPAPWWVMLALAALESAYFLRDRHAAAMNARGSFDMHLQLIAYALVTAFIVRHILVHLQSELMVGPFGVRLLVGLFGLAALLYAAMTPKPRGEGAPKLWEYVHPLLWEAFLAMALITSAIEIPSRLYPLSWVAGAAVLTLAGNLSKESISRFRLYALFFHWAAAAHIAFVASASPTPSDRLIDQSWIAAGAALVLQFGFVAYYFKTTRLDDIVYPRPLAFLGALSSFAARKKNLAVFYPFFISMALFLFWSFDRALLTLLWVLEAFLIFTLSLFLRENHFRFLSLIALTGCLVRLVVHDLAQSSILTKAVLCVGIGGLMVIMNLLYTRYKDRFNL